MCWWPLWPPASPADEDRSFGWYRAEIVGALVNGGFLLGMAFGFVLLWASWGILRDSVHLLMEGTPAEISLSDVTAALEELEGVADVHHVHAWALTSGRYIFSGHLRVVRGTDPQQVLSAGHQLIKSRFGFFFVTLQVETACLDESGAEAIDVTRPNTDEGL